MDSDINTISLLPEANVESRRDRWKRICRITIEPAVFLVFFNISFTSVVLSNQLIKQTCTTIFGYNDTLCEELSANNSTGDIHNIEVQIQPYVANVQMAISIAGTVGPAISGIFYGAWSDKFGRKPLLLLSATGYFMSSSLTTLLVYLSTIYTINPWLYVITTVPSSLVGGMCSFLGTAYCYIADITSEDQRPFKLAIFGAYISLGMFLGSLVCGYAIQALSVTMIFGINSALIFAALVYIAFCVSESLDSEKLEKTSKIKGLFQWILVRDMLQTLVQRRPNYDRMILWMCVTTLCLVVFAMEGSANIFYLYVREMFSWTADDYTKFNAISVVVNTTGATLAILIFQKVFKFPIVSIILMGLGCSVIDFVIKCAATKSWHLYFAVGLTATKGMALPSCRSLIATVVPRDEIGRVYAITTALEFMLPIGAAPLYTYVYNSTIGVFTGAFNIITTILYFICFLMFTVIYGLEVRYPSITNGPIKS